MKYKIAVLGSCVSRGAFNSDFVHDYKDFFEVTFDAQRTSLISLMQDSIPIDEKLIEINPPNRVNFAKTRFLSDDLNKRFLKDLLEKKIDYLIIDNYFEVIMGILYYDNSIITNNEWDLPLTKFYNEMKDKFILKITNFQDEYFLIWSKYCDLFFKFLNIECPNVKVVINMGRQTDKIMKSDGTIYTNSNFTPNKNIINPLLDKFDSYIINNFDVDVIEWDNKKIYGDENHVWGVSPVHYTKDYYYSLIDKLKFICQKDTSEIDNHSTNKYFCEEYSFKDDLNKINFETRILLKNIKNTNTNSFDSLNFYKRGRIDVKNFGSKYNKLEIIENEEINSIDFPNWLKTDEGEGFLVQSEKGVIDLKFKCINDGFLKIYLRGPDIRDKNNFRFPVYIDFTNFKVNDELIFKDNKLVWFDDPYLFKKEVKDLEIIDIHVEWLPFNSLSIYKK